MFLKIFSDITHFLFTIIAPPICAACDVYMKEESVLCVDCLAKIQPVASKEVFITKTKSVKIFAVSDYKYPLKRLVLAKHGSGQIASGQLGKLIWQKTDISNVNFDVIVPIPLHWSRYAWRGYNQAAEIARIISQESNNPVIELLKRTKRTKFQATLSPTQREQNVADVFTVQSKGLDVQGKHILLVDDLYTTGSTIKSAAKTLFQLRPQSITIVVACRVT